MGAKQKNKKKKRTFDEVLNCGKHCGGFPYSCLDCKDSEPVFKPRRVLDAIGENKCKTTTNQ